MRPNEFYILNGKFIKKIDKRLIIDECVASFICIPLKKDKGNEVRVQACS